MLLRQKYLYTFSFIILTLLTNLMEFFSYAQANEPLYPKRENLIKAVVFDLGGVVVEVDKKEIVFLFVQHLI